MKRNIKIIPIIVFTLIITGFFIIKNSTKTSTGKLDTYIAINLHLNKIFNP
jgi:acetyl esterase